MPRNTQLSTAVVNLQADVLAAQLSGGKLRIYSGAQPADADTAITTQNMLVELSFSAQAAPPAVGGLLTFNTITTGTCVASGTASWFRAFKSNGSASVIDGSVGLGENTPNLALRSTALSVGVSVVVQSFAHSVLKSATAL